ncbi:MAG TPA: C39 family peptidase [Burkholderiaceae bacterium]|nr:C39 family peptidase [Burkholderiaceae bacterium]
MKLVSALALLAGLCSAGQCPADSVNVPYEMGGAYSLPITSMKAARFRSMVHQQYDFSCGSAALSTLLTYHYGYKVSEENVFTEMYEKGDQPKIRRDGFSLFDMKRYLENHGFQADGFEAPLEKLESVAIPAIVLINENGYNHFVVVKGIRDGRVLVGDPSGGTRALTQASFERLWTNGILFVISNRQELAKFNVAAEWNALPRAPIANGINRDGLAGIVIPKAGPSDF